MLGGTGKGLPWAARALARTEGGLQHVSRSSVMPSSSELVLNTDLHFRGTWGHTHQSLSTPRNKVCKQHQTTESGPQRPQSSQLADNRTFSPFRKSKTGLQYDMTIKADPADKGLFPFHPWSKAALLWVREPGRGPVWQALHTPLHPPLLSVAKVEAARI